MEKLSEEKVALYINLYLLPSDAKCIQSMWRVIIIQWWGFITVICPACTTYIRVSSSRFVYVIYYVINTLAYKSGIEFMREVLKLSGTDS